MAEEQVLIRVDTVGAEASAAQVTSVGQAAEASVNRVAQAMQQMQSYTSGGITVMVPKTDELDPVPKKLEDIAGAGEKAAISGKLVHQQFNSMLPLVGMLNPRLGMLANTLEHVRYVSGRAGGSLKDLGSAMLGGLKALLRPELLIAAVAIAGIAYAYEKVTAAAAAAKKQIEDATEALKKQREEREKLRAEQEQRGQQTAAELAGGLLERGAVATPAAVRSVTESIADAVTRGATQAQASEMALLLSGKGQPPPTGDEITRGLDVARALKVRGMTEAPTREMIKAFYGTPMEAEAMAERRAAFPEESPALQPGKKEAVDIREASGAARAVELDRQQAAFERGIFEMIQGPGFVPQVTNKIYNGPVIGGEDKRNFPPPSAKDVLAPWEFTNPGT